MDAIALGCMTAMVNAFSQASPGWGTRVRGTACRGESHPSLCSGWGTLVGEPGLAVGVVQYRDAAGDLV
jgi:hypothetical protein